MTSLFAKLFGRKSKGSETGRQHTQTQTQMPVPHAVQVNWEKWSPAGEGDGRQLILSVLNIALTLE